MKEKRIIEAKGEKLAIFIPSSLWTKGLTFFPEDKDFIQVGTWGYDKGVQLQPHIHNEVRREISRTQEVIFVKIGGLKVELAYYEKNLGNGRSWLPWQVCSQKT